MYEQDLISFLLIASTPIGLLFIMSRAMRSSKEATERSTEYLSLSNRKFRRVICTDVFITPYFGQYTTAYLVRKHVAEQVKKSINDLVQSVRKFQTPLF